MTPELAPGLHPVPRGMVATVVTHLEMTAPPQVRPAPALDGVTFQSLDGIGVAAYRDLFSRVGALDWLWFSRMQKTDADLAAVLDHPDVALYTLVRDGVAEALLELDFRASDECELTFFGVTAALIGTGAGRVLMNHAIGLAWARPITRFHVHTCTLDHPAALSFYRRSGFMPIRQEIEIEPDPRLTGILPQDAGPHIPVFE